MRVYDALCRSRIYGPALRAYCFGKAQAQLGFLVEG